MKTLNPLLKTNLLSDALLMLRKLTGESQLEIEYLILYADTVPIKNHAGGMKYSICHSNSHKARTQNGYGIHN